MTVVTANQWSEEFFQEFVDYRNSIHRDIATSFPETLDDYRKYFSPDSAFQDYSWTAFKVLDAKRVVGQAILTWKKGAVTGNLGFIDWDNNFIAAEELISAVETTARNAGINFIKTPVDLNFFIKYRIRTPGGGSPFWGEPIYPDYYHDLFKHTGFLVTGEWDTYRLKKLQGVLDYLLKRKKLSKKPSGSHFKTKEKKLRTTVRCVRMDDWENELKIIHDLFVNAYKSMPEWESISFEQFKAIYDDFKYIINPLYAYIVELRGRPVGFSINFADPLSVLSKVKGKQLGKFEKALLFLKLRSNRSRLLIAHVGKIPGPDGEEIKGVQIQVSRRIQFVAALMSEVLVTFQMTNSPSRRSFEEKSQVLHAHYVLYGKSL